MAPSESALSKPFSLRSALGRCALAVGLIMSALLAQPARGGPAIADVAPASALVVVAVPDYARLIEHWKASELSKMVGDPELRGWLIEMAKRIGRPEREFDPEAPADAKPAAQGPGLVDRFNAALEDADIKLSDIPSPTGAIGASVALHTGADGKPTGDFDTIVLVNFDAEGAGKLEAALDKLLTRLEEKRRIELSEVNHGAIKIRVITERAAEGGAGEKAPKPEPLHVARVGSAFLVGSQIEGIKAAIDRAEGKTAGSLASTDIYRDSAALWPASGTVHAGVFIEPLSALLANRQAMDSLEAAADQAGPASGLVQMLAPLRSPQAGSILKALGIKGTRSIVASISLATDSATAEVEARALMPVRAGVLKLLRPEAARGFELPKFFHADVATATVSTIELSKLTEVLRQDVLPAFPEAERGEIEPMLQQAEGLAGPVLAGAGPEVYSMRVLAAQPDPKNAGEEPLVIVKLRDPAPLRNLLAGFGGQVGLKPKEFEGNQIYSGEDGEMSFVPAVGLGFEHVFVGQVELVRSAMRAAAAGGASLTDDPRFKRAAATTEPGAFFYQWTDTRKLVDVTIWRLQNVEKIVRDQMGDSGLPPEVVERIMKRVAEENRWASGIPDARAWQKYTGDIVTEIRWTDDGLALKLRMLKP